MSITLHDDVLGTLTYDEDCNCFRGDVPFGDKQVLISISFSSPSDDVPETEILGARAAYLTLIPRKAEIETAIANEYLELYNAMRLKGPAILTQEQFMSTLNAGHIIIELGKVHYISYQPSRSDYELFFGNARLVDVLLNDNGSIQEIAANGFWLD